ncbi:Eco57I restriction-modification methylase domain-containing protein [Hydrocarboniphaga sp.]|uniref:Eco57I restriction-modification methylase domain-containing protein n=1 Tax=Hydrocarboniphaga sp. TaxID=2033016 RepID=UPI003D0AC13E
MKAVEALSSAGAEQRGAIFTKREVVDFLLDLAGYTIDRPLIQLRLLEPSFGAGDFLLPALDRLLTAWKRAGSPSPYSTLSPAIRAVELHWDTFEKTRGLVIVALRGAGISQKDSESLAQDWLVYGDFLLAPLEAPFDVVIGNPPYVRQELIADALLAEYRSRYHTIYDRADLYVPFIERALDSLSPGGRLGFICADRWMKNRYGGPLRQLVANDFSLKIYVDMVDTQAFHTDVIAYPAIFVIAREAGDSTRTAHRPLIDAAALHALASQLLSSEALDEGSSVKELKKVAVGSEPWILESSDQLALIRRLERDFPLLEDAGCKVGIGVATGADKAFIGPYEDLEVEADRKLPLAMTRDIVDGSVRWRGLGVVNPFAPDGGLVDLAEYPLLRGYLEARRSDIAGRHVAQKAPNNWYRTIDRIYPALAQKPKLLIPDIKGEAHVVYENEGLYPHHNLYFITSDTWDLKALQAVLMSGIARLFVGVYSTKMRGGYLRFQAQYLRRIRLPDWSKVPAKMRTRLRLAAEKMDLVACNQAVFELYGLDENERAALGGNGT